MNPIFEIIGYVAMVITAVSLLMSSIIKLRWINFFGSTIFSVYGFLIESYPVAILNGFLAVVNVFYLVRIYSTKEYFQLLIPDYRSKYLQNFLEFYQNEIKRYLPDFDFRVSKDDQVLYILRDMVPAGVIIGKKDGHAFNVRLDYVIPSFQDFKIGKYVFGEKKSFFQDQGINCIQAKGVCKMHERYLRRMGFMAAGQGSDDFCLEL